MEYAIIKLRSRYYNIRRVFGLSEYFTFEQVWKKCMISSCIENKSIAHLQSHTHIYLTVFLSSLSMCYKLCLNLWIQTKKKLNLIKSNLAPQFYLLTFENKLHNWFRFLIHLNFCPEIFRIQCSCSNYISKLSLNFTGSVN